jgi:hypothetical protein
MKIATEITEAKKEKGKEEKFSLSVSIPDELHDKIRLDSLLSRKPVGTMVEEWIDQNVSPQEVTVGLGSLMNPARSREKADPDVTMKGLTVPVSLRHYGLIRMEAMRQNVTIRALLRSWIEENSRDWFIEQVDREQWQARKKA